MISFGAIKFSVLAKLYRSSLTDIQGGEIFSDDLDKIRPANISDRLVLFALQALHEDDILTLVQFSNGTLQYQLNASGFDLAANLAAEKDGYLFNYLMGGDRWLISLMEEDASGSSSPNSVVNAKEIPASDRTVSRADNAEAFEKASQAVDAAIDAIRSDNEFAATHEDERDAIVSSLEAGRRLLEGAVVRARAIGALLIVPFRYVLETTAKVGINKLVTIAIDALLKLIG